MKPTYQAKRALVMATLALVSCGALASVIPTSDTGPTNDPLSNYQWGLVNTGQRLTEDLTDIKSRAVQGIAGIDIGISRIYSQLPSLMKRDVIVAVLDSGIALDHPELANVIYKNTAECDSAGQIPFQPQDDKDGNGYKGDCMGWNFTAPGDGNNRPDDDIGPNATGHGTHVAGIIAAQVGNGYGVAGVAPRVKILPIKVTKPTEAGSSDSDFTDRVAKGIRYAIKMKADVINMSFGWPRSIDTEDVRAAIHEAAAAGVTIVAAAGNNRSERPIVPCSLDDVICVGSVDADGSLSVFSNFGGVVDILAPGSQILSTIPKQNTPQAFGIQGFDIKNGTSQAAPFVTAAVAILKGVLGPISNSEIRARLMLSSRKILSPVEASAGLLQVEAALKQKPEPFVHPVFKGLDLIPYDMNSRKFSFKLPIRNDWMPSGKIHVTLSTEGMHGKSSPVRLTTTRFDIPSLGREQSHALDLQGSIPNLDADSEFRLNVEVQSGSTTRDYSQSLILSRSIDGDPQMSVSPVQGLDLNSAVSLQTVTDPYGSLAVPEYYTTTSTAQGMNLKIYRRSNGAYSARELFIPKADHILNIYRLDLNGDGKLDYWIYAGSFNSKPQFLMLGYFNDALQPMLGNGFLTYHPEAVVPDLSTITFIPETVKTPRGTEMLKFPLFVGQGGIPAVDRNPDSFAQEDLGRKPHLYYLAPDVSKMEVNTRIIDRYDFLDKLQKDLNLEWDDRILLVGNAFQSEKAFQAGTSQAYLSIGSRFPRQYYTINVTANAATTITPIDTYGFSLDGAQIKPITRIATRSGSRPSYQDGTAFFGFQSQDTVSLVWTTANEKFASSSLQNALPIDPLVGSVASFAQGQDEIAFFEANSRIIAQVTSPSGTKVATHELDRSSFVPGKVFSELLTPIVAGSGSTAHPALYIDSTQLQSGSVSVMELSGDQLITRLRNTLSVPTRCLTLNPSRFEGATAFSLLCHEKDGSFTLRHLPIQ